ncbi:MAG: conjugal transfer protein TraB [Desulfobulbaceae bacterium]|nr:conjugal transfer protein TraB [Desulfobulbaceae bacterium]
MSSGKNQGDEHDKAVFKSITDEAILKVTKEIVVKFIECGRLSPANFDETFEQVYKKVVSTVRT